MELLNIQLVGIHREMVIIISSCPKIIQKSTILEAFVICIVGVFVYRSGVFSLIIGSYGLHFDVAVVSINDFLHAVAPLVVGVCLTYVSGAVGVFLIVALPCLVADYFHIGFVLLSGLVASLVHIEAGSGCTLSGGIEHVLLAIRVVGVEHPLSRLFAVFHDRRDISILVVLIYLLVRVAFHSVEQRKLGRWFYSLDFSDWHIVLCHRRSCLQKHCRSNSK